MPHRFNVIDLAGWRRRRNYATTRTNDDDQRRTEILAALMEIQDFAAKANVLVARIQKRIV